MGANYDFFEIVSVFRNFWLIDAESYQRKYMTRHGIPLIAGYYVVNWPEQVRARRFDEHAAFHGPFKTRADAQAALDWMHHEWQRVSNFGKSPLEATTHWACVANDKKLGQTDFGLGGWKPWITGFPPSMPRRILK